MYGSMKSLLCCPLLLIIVLQDATTVVSKPRRATATQVPIDGDKTPQPIFESQLTVWPSDVDDVIEAIKPTNSKFPVHSPIEQPVVVLPALHAETSNDFYDDDYDGFDVVYDPSSDLWPIITDKPEPAKPDSVITLQNYHLKYSNGSEEYKVVLSNGMVNYQRIDHILVKGVLKPVQQGYYTVPLQGTTKLYHTTYYRADEHGYNVYKTEQSPRNPAYDVYLQYAKSRNVKLL